MSESVADETLPRASFARRAGVFLLCNPLTQIVVGFVVVIGANSAVQQAGRLLPVALRVPLVPLLVAVTTLAAYALFVRLYDRRWPAEIAAGKLPRELPSGFALGSALLLTSAVLIHAGGWSHVADTAARADWSRLIGSALAFQFGVAVFEELLFRGILFRVVERSLGSWIALFLSAVIFGLIHVGNPNATWFAALGLSVQAGALLAAAYMATRSLWLPIGLHWGWNATQAGVVGGTVSGHLASAVVKTDPAGPDVLSGGAFGTEGSIIATGVCAAVAIALCLYAVRSGRIIPGFWVASGARGHVEPGAAADTAAQ